MIIQFQSDKSINLRGVIMNLKNCGKNCCREWCIRNKNPYIYMGYMFSFPIDVVV